MLLTLGFSLFIYLISLWFYRLYFHRISHIPGPRLAAFTYWYQSYYDLWPHSGQFLLKTVELHKQYGPILRVGPDEVQINDPAYYDEVYTSGRRRRDKSVLWFWFSGWSIWAGIQTGAEGQYALRKNLHQEQHRLTASTFGTLSHDLHRNRKRAIAPFFSRQKIRELEVRIADKVERLLERLLESVESNHPLDLYHAYSGLTLDVITQYTLGQSWGALDRVDFGAEVVLALQAGSRFHPFGRAFQSLARFVWGFLIFANSLTSKGSTRAIASYFNYVDRATSKIFDEATTVDQQVDNGSGKDRNGTVIDAMIHKSTLPPSERTVERLAAEESILMGAGTETTARTLAVGTYYILSRPVVHARLLAELRTVIPTFSSPIPALDVLETLPYLTAVIDETLRLANSAPARLVRIAPDEDLYYGSVKIPRGTTFGQSSWLVHNHPDYFSEPSVFNPDRWLGPHAEHLRQYLVPFSRGARACVGKNLAYAEMYLALATVVSKVDMQLFETTDADVAMKHEYFLASAGKDSKGIRVKVLGPMRQ